MCIALLFVGAVAVDQDNHKRAKSISNRRASAPRAIFCIQRQKAVFGRGALVQLFQPRYSLARRNAALQQTPKTPARAASQYEHRYDSSNNMNNSNIDKNSTIDHAT